MKKGNYQIIAAIVILYCFGCKKHSFQTPQKCISLTQLPTTIYNTRTNFFSGNQFNESICGYLPLNRNNYWVYRDSIFDNITGQFQSLVIDTLRFVEAYKYADSIVWWKPKLNNPLSIGGYKGYYNWVYSTDSVIYTLNEGVFGINKSLKWCFKLNTDSSFNFTNWSDAGGGMESYSYKINNPIIVPAGTFSNCGLFIKYANMNYALTHIYATPGIGIIKSRVLNGSYGGSGNITIKTSELISYHIE